MKNVAAFAATDCPSWARSRRPSPKENGRCCCTGHCPSWARTRTLLIQRGHHNQPNSSDLLPFTRVRVTRCWSLLALMLDFAVLYSHKCRSLLPASQQLPGTAAEGPLATRNHDQRQASIRSSAGPLLT